MVVGGGLVAVPGPGPGWLIILLGLVMIAGESLSFARFADRAEIKLRRLATRVAAVDVGAHLLCYRIGVRDLSSYLR